jgi:GTP-binding protein
VSVGEGEAGLGRSFAIADIPGLIPGASSGAGLGIRFLKHLERTRVLLHLITVTTDPERSPLEDYRVIRKELEAFSPELAERPEVVALSKADLPEVREAYEECKPAFEELGIALHLVSAAAHQGTDSLLFELSKHVFDAAHMPPSNSPPSSPPP